MGDREPSHPEPPRPPEIERRIQLSRVQQIGIPLLLLFPILALFGVFGNTLGTATNTSGPIELTVEYPNRTRYQARQAIEIAVRNTTDQALTGVTVNLDRDYLDAFEDVTFTPEVTAITDAAYHVDLTDLPPGDVRYLTVELRPHSYWAHQGTISAGSPEAESTDVEVRTFVFP
jgi:hypothetical protein